MKDVSLTTEILQSQIFLIIRGRHITVSKQEITC